MTKNNLKVVKPDNKKTQEIKEKNKSLEAAISQIDQNFGKGSVMRLGQQEALDIEAISTGSLSLDLALGIGGLPKGRIIEIYGPESSGKTTLALQVVAEAQKSGGICAFVDAEHAMDPAYAKKLGVKTDELLISSIAINSAFTKDFSLIAIVPLRECKIPTLIVPKYKNFSSLIYNFFSNGKNFDWILSCFFIQDNFLLTNCCIKLLFIKKGTLIVTLLSLTLMAIAFKVSVRLISIKISWPIIVDNCWWIDIIYNYFLYI